MLQSGDSRFVLPPTRPSVYEGNLELYELFGAPASTDYIVVHGDTIRFDFYANLRAHRLTDNDYREVADSLGVDVAAIKAIVEIETGRTRRGFNADSTPVISFNPNVFNTMLRRNKIDLSTRREAYREVLQLASTGGSGQKTQRRLLHKAMAIDTVSAIEATFWGMFQIGGFNWRRCGASSAEDFADQMSRNERDQLDLFAHFMRSSGLLPHLQNHNWMAFARGYNGPSYARHRYHTRLAAAYKKYNVK